MISKNKNTIEAHKPRFVKRSLNESKLVIDSQGKKNELQNEDIKLDKVRKANNISSLAKFNSKKEQKVFNKQLLKNIRKKNEFTSFNEDQPLKLKQQINTILPSIRKTQIISYKNIKLLRSFLTDFKKIKSRRLTKLTLKQQRQLSRSVKRARMLKLFDPRKTLKPKKFLNLERKRETLQTLLLLQVISRKNFLETIKRLKIENVQHLIKLFALITLSENKNYLSFK